eukprot:scaffold40683_cov39-Cyclotella_meneghiniana.AAC.2
MSAPRAIKGTGRGKSFRPWSRRRFMTSVVVWFGCCACAASQRHRQNKSERDTARHFHFRSTEKSTRKSQIFSEAGGSAAGLCISKNRGKPVLLGQVFRYRFPPTVNVVYCEPIA